MSSRPTLYWQLGDFHCRAKPSPEEMEAMIRAGGFDEFGQTRGRQFWEAQRPAKADGKGRNLEFDFEAGRNSVSDLFVQNPALLREPTHRERLEAGTELFGYAIRLVNHASELIHQIYQREKVEDVAQWRDAVRFPA